MTPRPLAVLDLNDEPDRGYAKSLAASLFKIDTLRSWQDVQDALARARDVEADILLVDVSFGKDPRVEGAALAIKSDSPIIPIGPMLALPFLHAREVVAFAPYSAHLSNPVVQKQPEFLIAMGLIAAKTKGRKYASTELTVQPPDWSSRRHQDVLDWVDYQAIVERKDGEWSWVALSKSAGEIARGTASTKTKARGAAMAALQKEENSLREYLRTIPVHGAAPDALARSLPIYRKAFVEACGRGAVVVRNGIELEELTVSLDRAIAAQTSFDLSPAIGVEFQSERAIDNVQLLSMFADRAGWRGTRVPVKHLAELKTFIESIIALDDCFDNALRLMIGKQAPDATIRVDVRIKNRFGSATAEERRAILRHCVLMANIRAWVMSGETTVTRSEVVTWLGVEPNSYHAFFGRRKVSGKTRQASGDQPLLVCKETLAIAALDPLRPGVEGIDGCYMAKEGTRLSAREHLYLQRFLHDWNPKYLPNEVPYSIE